MGLPLSLDQCGEVLHLEQGKMNEGRALIRYFSKPDVHTGKRHVPSDSPERWNVYKAYNKRDVEVEQAILKRVELLEAAPFDDALYLADQEINDRGVLIDLQLAKNAARMDANYKAHLLQEAQQLTGLDNPNSPSQIKSWLHNLTGFSITTLNKKSLEDLEDSLSNWPKAKRLLKLRKEIGKTSNKKYAAMLECVCSDQRIHGLLQFCGAARTGRWAGRLVQVQNLPQNHISDIDFARRLVRSGQLGEVEMYYDNVTQTLSELIRTAFIAKEGCIFHVCDFSAIEARVIAWLAGENWVIDVFRNNGDIYCATASKMFGVPVEKHGLNAELRPKGKVSVLALGYGGGINALEAMGGLRLGLTVEEMKETVKLWRRSNRHIVELWDIIERAAISAIKTGDDKYINHNIRVWYKWGMLLITLPSGRTICYPRAAVSTELGTNREGIEYEGIDQTTKQWGRIRTYGGKLTENIVQATARDILGTVILRAKKENLPIVFHVHDEIIVECPEDRPLSDVEALFDDPIDWCRSLPLKGAGYSTKYYIKD
jgi:DNA polymerase